MALTDGPDGDRAASAAPAVDADRQPNASSTDDTPVDGRQDSDPNGLIARYRRWRAGLESRPASRKIFRLMVGIIGTIVLCVGIIAIPYPGPGWLIVFAGLGILASEFDWAQSVLRWVRAKYDIVMGWYLRQNLLIRGLGALLTCVVVIATLWLLGAVGMVAGWFGFDQDWLNSPIF